MDEKVEGKIGKDATKKDIKKPLIIAGIVLGILLVVYVAISIYMRSHFYFRSNINGASSSGKSVDAVIAQLSEYADGYTLSIKNGSEVKTISAKDIGMKAKITNEEVSSLLDNQIGFDWPYRLFKPKNYLSENLVTVSEDDIAKVAKDYASKTTGEDSADATIVFDENKYVIVPEVYGTKIDEDALAKLIKAKAIALDSQIVIEEDGVYILPKIKRDDKKLVELLEQFDKIASMKITYTVGSANEVLEGEDLRALVGFDENLELIFDEDAIESFIRTMRGKYDTMGKPKTLATQYGTTVTVPGGNYGWKIDYDGEVEQLKADIIAGKDVSRDFVYQYTAASREGNDYGNSYVEINRTAQQVFLIIDGNCVLQTGCVTGKPDGKHTTPTGAYRMTYTERNATLRGDDYATPVAYWMPFNGDIGLHDATWQSSFGGQRYAQGYGSHGCVNLPLSAAGTIFSYVSTGFPVLMYDIAGTETIDTATQNKISDAINTINTIGDVDLSKAEIISSARAKYEALSEFAKTKVTNIQVLIDAEANYSAQVQAAEAQRAAEEEARRAAEEAAAGVTP